MNWKRLKKWKNLTDDEFETRAKDAGNFAAAVAIVTLSLALWWRLGWGPPPKDQPEHGVWFGVSRIFLAGWTLVPPLWFWWQWYQCPYKVTDEKWEQMKHGHEVSRNLWIAFVVVLAALWNVSWSGG